MPWLPRRSRRQRADAAAEPAPLPAQDPREMLNDWLRTLTIVGEKHTPAEALDLIATVNQPRTVQVSIRTPLPPDDARALNDSLAWWHEARSRQAGINILIETVLIQWLAEATNQSWSQIVQRLALELQAMLPPDPHPPE